MGYTEAELSLVIVGDDEMASLNQQYRRKNSTTDVLAFPMLEGEFENIYPPMLGDVVISAPTAALMSRQHQRSMETVLDALLVHGILHLAGYDHEGGGEEAMLMREKSIEVLEKLGYPVDEISCFLPDPSQP